MAVRLHMKLGVVAEHDRLGDSPDTLVVVEPSVGSVARSKGHLYLLVTSRISSKHAFEATRLAAETIRNEYYYDESAGIRVCLQKAIATANKRLAHQADRLGLKSPDGNGPIGIGVAVVRGSEMYVATVGPAEAYLIRQARLSTLPDPHRERGLPSGALEPDVWRGEISVGDSLVLISPNVIAKLGADELKDAMLTLHPQSAIEHLHHRFIAADGAGSDGAIAFEATEVSSTSRARTLVPVRPAEPLAGAPDRSPIPLADNVQAAGNAVSAAAVNARSAAGGAIERTFARLQDFMPRRKPAYRRVTPLASRRETQRRAAMAVLALIVVMGGLGIGVYLFADKTPPQAISSANTGQKALDQAKANLARVSGPGIDLVADDPNQALDLLTDAMAQLDAAAAANVGAAVIDPLRKQARDGLDRLYGVVLVASTDLVTFEPAEGKDPIDLTAIVRGPDGAPYVLDRSTGTVYRIGLKDNKPTVVVKTGTKNRNGTVAAPRFLATGGQDLLILDAKNTLWRWRPADDKGKGTLTKVTLQGSASLGDDVVGINTFLRPGTQGLYNLYVVDPSEEQIRLYSPAADGSGFPAKSSQWLAVTRDVSKMTSTYVDGDMFVTDDGALDRYVSGKDEGWSAKAPRDVSLRPAPVYSIVAGGTERRVGQVYAFDRPNQRVVGLAKSDGRYVEQYRLAGEAPDWSDMRGMYVIAGTAEEPSTLVWISADGVHQAVLEAVSDAGPVASPSPSIEPSPSPDKTKKPGKTPKPTKKPEPDAAVIPLRDANPTRRLPIWTVLIVIACVVAFAWELGLMFGGDPTALDDFIATWGVVPADLSAAWGRGDYLSQETATLVTSQFLHGGWLHLGGNMLYLWIFGNNVEDRFGRIGFPVFYLLGGVLAGLAQVVIDPTSPIPTIGASGAIAATLGAYLVLFPRARVTTLIFLGFFYQLIHVPAIIVLGFWFVLQLIDGLTSLGVAQTGGGVAFFAHIGGFVVGAAVAWLLKVVGGPGAGPAGGAGSLRAPGPTTRRGVG